MVPLAQLPEAIAAFAPLSQKDHSFAKQDVLMDLFVQPHQICMPKEDKLEGG